MLDGGVAPADHVHLQALVEGVLDQASPRGQVHEVVLVDLRRDQYHRHGVDLLGEGRVLQQLADLVAEDHRPRGDAHVATDHVGTGVGGAGHPTVGEDIPGDVGRPGHQAAATGLVGAFHGVGVEEQGVGGGQGRGHQGGGQPGPLFGAPVHRGVLHQGQRGAGPGQVGLAQTSEGRVFGPGRVLETPVLGLGGDVRLADDDLAQFEADADHGAGEGGDGADSHLHGGIGQSQRIDAAHEAAGHPGRSPHYRSSERTQRRLCPHQPRVEVESYGGLGTSQPQALLS